MDVDRSVPPAWRRWLLLVLVLSLPACSSSSDSLNPVQGTVLAKDQPAAGAMVVFHPKSQMDDLKVVRPLGLVKDDGTFSVMTGTATGAPVGDYIITITWPQAVGPKRRKGEITTEALPNYEDRLKGAYGDRMKSKFETVHVKKGLNQLEPFVLK